MRYKSVNFVTIAQGIRPCGGLYFTFRSNLSKNFNFGAPTPLSLHRWGEIWHGGCQISPPSVQHVAPAGRKPHNRPLSKLNTGRLALRAMLPVDIYGRLRILFNTKDSKPQAVSSAATFYPWLKLSPSAAYQHQVSGNVDSVRVCLHHSSDALNKITFVTNVRKLIFCVMDHCCLSQINEENGTKILPAKAMQNYPSRLRSG